MRGARRRARELALKTLFEVDTVGHQPGQVMARLLEETPLPSSGISFSEELVRGVLKHQSQIDALIRDMAPAWPVAQLSLIDRNILRLAIFELMFDNKVPEKAAISEAVELAKTFGSESSPKFINGVLGSLGKRGKKSRLGERTEERR